MHKVHIHGSKGKQNVGVHKESCQQLSKKIYFALLPSPFPHVYRPVDWCRMDEFTFVFSVLDGQQKILLTFISNFRSIQVEFNIVRHLLLLVLQWIKS